MSVLGGTLTTKAPLYALIRPVVALLIAFAATAAIGFGVIEMTREPVRSEATVAELDWGSTTGHPRDVRFQDRSGIGNAGSFTTP
jgi:hypothetical protein